MTAVLCGLVFAGFLSLGGLGSPVSLPWSGITRVDYSESWSTFPEGTQAAMPGPRAERAESPQRATLAGGLDSSLGRSRVLKRSL